METASIVKPKCGIVMPISAMLDYPADHWNEVFQILSETLNKAGFETDLVSNSDDTSIIQKTIVQNLYSNDLVICDVSGKNANVMFELGLRLAFDKPTIIIKDEITSYSFDTSVIEHLEYPRGLNFHKINLFKDRLHRKALATLEKSKIPEYSSFLKSFGEFKVAQLREKAVSADELMLEELKSLRLDLRQVKDQLSKRNSGQVFLYTRSELQKKKLIEMIAELASVYTSVNKYQSSDYQERADVFGFLVEYVASHPDVVKLASREEVIQILNDLFRPVNTFENN